MNISEAMKLAVQAWRTEKTKGIEMIPELAEAFAEILAREVKSEGDHAAAPITTPHHRTSKGILEPVKAVPNLDDLSGSVDLKYEFLAVNPCTGNFHSHKDAVVFLAKDKCFLDAIANEATYEEALRYNGAQPEQIEAARQLVSRIRDFQVIHGFKIPDVTQCEVERTVK